MKGFAPRTILALLLLAGLGASAWARADAETEARLRSDVVPDPDLLN